MYFIFYLNYYQSDIYSHRVKYAYSTVDFQIEMSPFGWNKIRIVFFIDRLQAFQKLYNPLLY